MSLGNPRVYQWSGYLNEPFILTETVAYDRTALRAGDGHAIPFPRRLLGSEAYYRAESVRVMLLTEDGISPRYPGIDYVMEILMAGYRRTISEAARDRMRRYCPGAPQLTPVGNALLEQMRNPSPLATAEHWTQRIRLLENCSTEQMSGNRVAVSCEVREATVRYDAILPMHP